MSRFLSFTNSLGREYIFRNILSLSGFDMPPVSHISITSSGQDGASYTRSYLQPRELKISFDIFADKNISAEAARRNLINRLSPKNGEGRLAYHVNNSAVMIRCVLDSLVVTRQSSKILTALVCFKAFSSYFIDSIESKSSLKFVQSLLVFPVTFPCVFGTRTNTGIIQNLGDAPAPVVIRFYGGVTSPSFINHTTNEAITLSGTIATDEILEINTAFGVKSITLISGNTRTNAFSMLDPRSQLWSLAPGKNEIEYTCEMDNDDSFGEVAYFNRYLGV